MPLRLANIHGSKIFWRFHPIGREFMPETAHSTPIADEWRNRRYPTERGFSAVRHPWHLFVYGASMGWLSAGGPSRAWENDIIGFTGKEVGEGHDGEPLVMPDMSVVMRFSFREFVQELFDTPFPLGYSWSSGGGSWQGLARDLAQGRGRLWNDNEPAGPLALHIIKTFAPEALQKTAANVDVVAILKRDYPAVDIVERKFAPYFLLPDGTVVEFHKWHAEIAGDVIGREDVTELMLATGGVRIRASRVEISVDNATTLTSSQRRRLSEEADGRDFHFGMRLGAITLYAPGREEVLRHLSQFR